MIAIHEKQRGFADVGYDEAMRRASNLVPFLREHASEGETERRMPKTVSETLHREGLFRYLQPKSRGGMELDFVACVDVPEMLARGDCSVAWNVANLASHHRTLALFSDKAQQEVWTEDPDALIAAGIAYPQGRGRKTPEGVLLSGTWNFCSGVLDAGWNMLACVVRDGEQPVDWVQCLLRKSDYEVVDDWHTMGMRGTGSCTVKVNEVLVPPYRTQSMATALPGHQYAGVAANPNAMYRVPTSALGAHPLAACVVGAARAALDSMIDWVKVRSTNYTGAKMRDFQTVQLRIGLAGGKIDAARLILRSDCLEADATVKSGELVSIETKLRYKRNAALAVRLAVEAVDTIYEMAGANGIYEKSPLQRIFRDVRAASEHIHFSTDMQMTQWGLVALGGEFKSPTL